MKGALAVLATWVALSLCWALPAAAGAPAGPTNEDCLGCHADKGLVKEVMPLTAFRTRLILNGAYLDVDHARAHYVVATDGRRLALARGEPEKLNKAEKELIQPIILAHTLETD